MSVAFRREGDDEHKEPRFELPLPPGPNLVTRAGLADMERRLAEAEATLAGANDAEARTAAQRDLRYWRTRVSTAQVTAAPADGSAGFGTRIRFRLNGSARTIALVGSDQADPAAGLVPFTAPLAMAMTGAEAGESVDFGGRADAIEILAIEPIEP